MRSNKQHTYGLIFSLLIIGSSLFLYRHFILEVPLADHETVNSWMVEAQLRFTAEHSSPVKASFIIPYLPPHFAILDEYFVSHNYGVTTNLNEYNRQTIWSTRRAKGPQSLYYRAIFRETDNTESSLTKPPAIKKLLLSEQEKYAVETISARARQSSADIQTFAQSTIKELNKSDGNTKLLIETINDENIVKAAILILNQAKIFAMPVTGFYLNQTHKVDFKLLMVVYNGKDWIYINPRNGSAGLPKNFLVWQYGFDPMFSALGTKKVVFNLSISPTPVNALSVAKTRGLQTDSQLLRFSLLQLPVSVQETYKILLTVPIGAFIILLLRNFIGLKTFGTFMPVLIALAFRESQIIWSIVLFIFIISLGLLTRFYLDQLRLLLVPRLAAILTIVISLMIFIGIFSQNLGLELGLSIPLFPMVIITMTIERMCITWDERGAADAIKSGLGSLLAALAAFPAMGSQTLQYLLFAFPELLLILLALILWFGQYRGYRLLELSRFRVLGQE